MRILGMWAPYLVEPLRKQKGRPQGADVP